MEYRQVGRTAVRVSAVGIGTCQFQVLPERQAVETLLAGFERGVNLVHTAPDYGPAERYIARAMAECGRDIVVASQGFDVAGNRLGRVDHFERLFEQTCKRLGTERLELYGIACIDDREAYEENVWGLHGMVEFLQKKKQEGRLGGGLLYDARFAGVHRGFSEERRFRCDHAGLQCAGVSLTHLAAAA